MLRYETPVVYDLIMQLALKNRKRVPDPDLIAIVCTAFNDPAFDKPRFRRYMEEYRRKRVWCGRGKTITPEREAYYEALHKRKLSQYIEDHRQEIELFRSGVFDLDE